MERKYKHPQVNLRLPTDLKDRIQELAEFNNRSANQEMVAAIEYWILRNSHVEVLTISDAAERIFQLEREMEVVKEKLGLRSSPHIEGFLSFTIVLMFTSGVVLPAFTELISACWQVTPRINQTKATSSS